MPKSNHVRFNENVCTSQFEGAEYKSNVGILQFFIQKLSLGKLVPKLKSYCIYLNICTQANLKLTKLITNQIIKNNKTASLCEKQGYLPPPIN